MVELLLPLPCPPPKSSLRLSTSAVCDAEDEPESSIRFYSCSENEMPVAELRMIDSRFTRHIYLRP